MKERTIPIKSSLSAEERQAISRLRQLLNAPGFLRASLINHRRHCGKDYCRCATSKRHQHRSLYVGFSHKGRLQMKCLPEAWAEPVRLWITRYREAEALLNKISRLYWEQVKRARR